jgi:prolyl 4-hydroxylase
MLQRPTFHSFKCDAEEEFCLSLPETLLPKQPREHTGTSSSGGSSANGKKQASAARVDSAALDSAGAIDVESEEDSRPDTITTKLSVPDPSFYDKNRCEDQFDSCGPFAANGECSKNPGWMTVYCPISCRACDIRDPKLRCTREFLNVTNSRAYQTTPLDVVFGKLKSRLKKYGPVTVHSKSPWVVTVDNFVSDDEVHDLIYGVDHWERSTNIGGVNEFGELVPRLSRGRTSSSAWCYGSCEKQPSIVSLLNRISKYVDVAGGNIEAFQVLRYDVGQHHVSHYDFSNAQRVLPCGPRIVTVLLYLNDVELGGETVFPELGVIIKPKKGRAVFFPNVLSSNLEVRDDRTIHKAKAVQKGQKFSVNTWIHLYDFKQANLWGCTGHFEVS